jgi:putative nucleotidyltransferase with HDIG domain
MNLPTRDQSQALLEKYIKTEALRHHCHMVAQAMEVFAIKFGEDKELWFTAGLLHDLDYEQFPDEHPQKAVVDLLGDYPEEIKNALLAHAPGLTGREPQTKLEKYLFASDELSGLMHAVSLMRPNGFSDMKAKSVKKKIKDKSFAAKVSREDIRKGFELIDETPEEHIEFLVQVFR